MLISDKCVNFAHQSVTERCCVGICGVTSKRTYSRSQAALPQNRKYVTEKLTECSRRWNSTCEFSTSVGLAVMASNQLNSYQNVPDYISSTSNPFVKYCVKLRQSKALRESTGRILVIGNVPLREICDWVTNARSPPEPVIDILLLQDGNEQDDGWLDLAGKVVRVSPVVMAKVAGVESGESIGAVGLLPLPSDFADVRKLKGLDQWSASSWLPGGKRVLALERIQDPGNVGTLLRTALAFNWDAVFLLPGCCDPFNDKALRASRGAAYRLPLAVGQWEDLELLSKDLNLVLYSGDPEQELSQQLSKHGNDVLKRTPNSRRSECKDSILSRDFVRQSQEALQAASMEEKLCLVLGSEGQGLSEEAILACKKVAIPMPGGMESLNVAVAGGILLYVLNPGRTY